MSDVTNKSALKAGSWYVISNFMIKGIAILTTPIFTRLLSPEDFGITNTYTSWLAILTIIGTLDIYSCVQIARHDYEDSEIDAFISSILTLSSLSLFLVYILIKSIGDRAYTFLSLPPMLLDVMFVEVLLVNAFTILQTKHKAYFKYKQFVFFSAIIAILSPLFAVGLISIQESDLYYGKIIGNAIPKILVSLFIYIYIMAKGKKYFQLSYWKYALIITIPLIPHHLAGSVLNSFDKIMINKYIGPFETGLYSLAYSFSLFLSIAWTSFNQAWVPWFYSKMKTDSAAEIKKISKPYIITFSMLLIFMLTIGPEAIKIFGPQEYWEGKWVIPPVLLGIYFQFIYSLYVNLEFYVKKTQYIALGTILAAAINLILNYIFIRKYGYIAAAYTTFISYLVLYILHYTITSNWEKRDLFGKKFIIGWSVFILLITTIIGSLYDEVIPRYMFFIAIVIMIIAKYYKQILFTYSSLRRK